MGDSGAVAVARALEGNSTIVKLDLSNNQIMYMGALAISKALRKNSTVTEVNLSKGFG